MFFFCHFIFFSVLLAATDNFLVSWIGITAADGDWKKVYLSWRRSRGPPLYNRWSWCNKICFREHSDGQNNPAVCHEHCYSRQYINKTILICLNIISLSLSLFLWINISLSLFLSLIGSWGLLILLCAQME